MKVPPKRKGNGSINQARDRLVETLNESPSEKEGKWLDAVVSTNS